MADSTAKQRCERCGEDDARPRDPAGPDGGPVCHGCRSELTWLASPESGLLADERQEIREKWPI